MEKSIGILGGMGPLATADLLRKIVLVTRAEKDGDHVRVYIDDNPHNIRNAVEAPRLLRRVSGSCRQLRRTLCSAFRSITSASGRE